VGEIAKNDTEKLIYKQVSLTSIFNVITKASKRACGSLEEYVLVSLAEERK